MNKKGFNLFTAMVSFLLIMLTVLLANSMVQTERKASETIAGIESRSNLEAVAQMARADALQVFNYTLRKKVEDWLTDPQRGSVTLQLQNKTWEEIKQDFAESKFGGPESEAFATFTSNALIGMFYSPAHFGNYRISLEGRDTLKTGLQKAVVKSVGEDFFTVIDCEGGDPRNCPKGTFYVNLHLDKLTQEEYEALPKLNVVDKATGEELKEVILPRRTFRVYVPLRFFKAIAEARALTHYPLDEDEIDTANDKGLFSPRVHNEIEEIALGVCDYGYCAPRQNPFTPPESKTMASLFCPGDTSAPDYRQGIQIAIQCPQGTEGWCPAGLSYNANNDDGGNDMKQKTGEIAEAKVCDVVKKAVDAGFLDAGTDDKFSLEGRVCEHQGKSLAHSIEINVDARDSKKVEPKYTTLQSSPGFGGAYNPETCSRDNSFGAALQQATRTGLYREGEEVKPPRIGLGEMECSGSWGDRKSKCAEVKSVKVTLAFRERDTNYMVTNPDAPGSNEKVYRISVYDNTYVPFTGQFDQGSLGSDCLYSQEPSPQNCTLDAGQGWHCYSIRTTPDVGQYNTAGCMPS